MNERKASVRVLSFLLALVMFVGLMPLDVFAASGDVDYLFIATDRHENTSVIGNIINNMETYIGENALDYLALGGDMVGSGSSHPTYNSSTVLAEVTGATSSLSAANVDIVAGIHDVNVNDDALIVLPYQGGGAKIYEGDNFYVYGVEEYCISEDSSEDFWSAQAQAFVTWANGSTIDQSKVIVVVSHYPLHVKRDDNDGAYYWHQALNTVATGSTTGTEVVRDILFFHGHNHTKDKTEYCYNVGDTMSIQNGSSTVNGTIYYTYATAGYLNDNQKATLVTITDDTISLTKYGTSGSGTALTSVSRVVTETAPTLVSIAVSNETTEYTVGGTFVAPTVTATYSDGTTGTITDATFTGYDMSTAGTQTVTVTYDGVSTSYTITVSPTVNTVSADTTYLDDNGESQTNGDVITATGLGLTGVSAVFNETDLSSTYGTGSYSAYDVALTGYTENETTAVTFDVYNVDLTGATVYLVAEDGTLTAVEATAAYDADKGCTTISFSATGEKFTVAFGVEEVTIPADYALTGLEITNAPDKAKYFAEADQIDGTLYLDITGLEVTATFSDGTDSMTKIIEWNQFDSTLDGYALSFDMTVVGEQEVEVSYTYGEAVCYAKFTITNYAKSLTDETTSVVVETDTPGVNSVTVTESANGNVAVALADLMENYIAYDITVDADYGTDDNVTYTVTLPIPEGVENPVVYYVSDDGATVTNMGAVVGESTVTFTTTHFSTYVVGDSTEIEVLGGTEVNVEGSSTEEVTVYVLTDELTDDGEYLIVNTNASGEGYALLNDSGSVGSATVTINNGSLTIDGTPSTETYIILDNAYAVWTAGANGEGHNLTNTIDSTTYYLLASGQTSAISLNTSSSDYYWVYTGDDLISCGGTNKHYIYYDDGFVSAKNEGSTAVYIYQKQVATVSTTVAGTYSIAGNPAEVTATVISDDTLALGSTLTFTPSDGSTATTTDTSATATYTVVEGGDPNGVISAISDNTVTFTGNTGKALVMVTYTITVGETSYTVTNYILITAVKRDYQITIAITEDDVTTPADSSMTAKQGATLDLSGTVISYVDGNGETQTVSGQTITWTVTDGAAIADGVLTVNEDAADTEVVVTASWTDPYDNIITDTLTLNVVDAVWALDLCEPVVATAYEEGATYYTKGDDGVYTVATVTADTFSSGTYYTIESITAPVVVKDVVEGQVHEEALWAVITKDGEDIGAVEDKTLLSFVSSNTALATVDSTTGIVTFTGGEGVVSITALYEYAEGKYVTDTVIFSISQDHYYVPEDGTDDFPEYPNEGAIRFDKTATSVGNFSETGIAQVELSMTGVPFNTGSEIDVVVMLDMTGSMSDDGMEAAEEATKAFVEIIVTNEDGSYNDNRVAVYAFNSGGQTNSGGPNNSGESSNSAGYEIYELVALTTIENDTALDTVNSAIDDASEQQEDGGTPYYAATKQCYDVLNAAKTDGIGDDRQQFCVFMSDGGPTEYYGTDSSSSTGYISITNDSSSDKNAIVTYLGNYTSATSSDWSMSLPTEYYTDLMKDNGVTIYTVGLLLQNTASNASPWSSLSSVSSVYDSTTDSLTTIGTHYYFTSEILKQMASSEDNYIDIFTVANADNAVAKFKSIAMKIMEAAKDVTVVDKISDDFTLVFDFPNDAVAEAISGQEFYIEVKEYTLNEVTDEDGNIVDYTRGTASSLVKLYIGTASDGSSYYAASDAAGTAFAAPTFNDTPIGTRYYWSTDSAYATYIDAEGNTVNSITYIAAAGTVTTTAEDGTTSTNTEALTLYFATDGGGEYNLASGAYAYGTPTVETVEVTTEGEDGTVTTEEVTTTTCQNLVIITPYFVYDASTKMMIWTVDKLSETELALSYFVYLDGSGGYSGSDEETAAGSYVTNEYAYMNYTNFQNTECEVTFPVPQVTWNGAQVSYVFYLVNDAGQPVNRAGRVVPMSEAVYVTDVETFAIVWNKLEQSAGLEAQRLAEELVPEVYKLFDSGAAYKIHVYENEAYVNLNNHFVIESGETTYTTYVFNTKADSQKYNVPGAYVANDNDETDNETGLQYMCKSYAVTATVDDAGNVTAATYSGEETQVPSSAMTSTTGASILDGYAYYVDADGQVYTIVYKNDGTEVSEGFDFANTTVAFAVVWRPELVADTVVIDYGLDVVVDVTTNDALASGVVGVRDTAPSGVNINSGTYSAGRAITTDIVLNDVVVGTASVESLTSVRFSLNKDNGMLLSEPVTFYYESDVNYYIESELNTVSMYSSVTVIPATTVYYEDEYVTLTTYNANNATKDENGNLVVDSSTTYDATSGWDVSSVISTATQALDRPGASKIGEAYDADNNYGFDAAYNGMSTYSMGSAAMTHVQSGKYATATFSFYGTGFDVISMTSNTTGTITVKVVGPEEKNLIVDTYYGYEQNEDGEWVISEKNDPNALYQVPVIKVTDLTYGQYTVTITASYVSFFDHTTPDGYDLYLDAIRIYDPTGNLNDTANEAYQADGEGWPVYEELRNNIIAASEYTVTENEDGTVTVTGSDLDGAIFIDSNDATTSISDYVSYGPNNELYLDVGQSIAFNVDLDTTVADVQLGIKSATGEDVTYMIGNPDDFGEDETADSYTVNTATDMYYSILDYANGGTVAIKNVSGGILSLTNIKVTYTEAPAETSEASLLSMDAGSATYTLMSLRALSVADTETETTEPETESTEPEIEATEPETEATEPETEATEPETEATEPETEATEPETEATEPETEATEPETEATEPETEATETETEATETETEATEPEAGDTNENESDNTIMGMIGRFVKKLFGWLFG